MIVLDEMRAIGEQYAALDMRPLRITAEMSDPVAYYHPVHIDGILASRVVEEVTRGAGVPPSQDWYYTPLPLEVVWHNADGVPLWTCTDLAPDIQWEQEIVYLHRRAPDPIMTRKNLDVGSGRHKEKRTPLPTIVAESLTCDVVGNAQEIARLLLGVTAIGKKRTVLGSVATWSIEPINRFTFVDDQNYARRPIPLGYLDVFQDAKAMAYSAPYWHMATRMLCVPPGAYVEPSEARYVTS